MTTTLHKLIFNAVQHHPCQIVAQDITRCKIAHFLSLTEGNVTLLVLFCFSLQLLQALELSPKPGVPFCSQYCYVNQADLVKVKGKQILFSTVLRNNTANYLRVFCIWREWDNTETKTLTSPSVSYSNLCWEIWLQKMDCVITHKDLPGLEKVGKSRKVFSKLPCPEGERHPL